MEALGAVHKRRPQSERRVVQCRHFAEGFFRCALFKEKKLKIV